MPTQQTQLAAVKPKLTIREKVVIATLNDCTATQEFVRLLPLTGTLTDLHRTEKVSVLPK